MTSEIEGVEVPWRVDDPENTTEIDEERGLLTTTMPTGLRLGWDDCGCGSQVAVCGCDPITLPKRVVKMRVREQALADALAEKKVVLEARESDEELASVEDTGNEQQAAGEGASGTHESE